MLRLFDRRNQVMKQVMIRGSLYNVTNVYANGIDYEWAHIENLKDPDFKPYLGNAVTIHESYISLEALKELNNEVLTIK